MVAALEGFGSKPTTGEARLTDFAVGKKEVPEEKKRDIGERRESQESPSGGVRYFFFLQACSG
jgi:hypothetical protein